MSLFIAVRGVTTDGHQYIAQAISAGATSIVCENLPEEKVENVTYIQVTDSSESLGYIASNFYDSPSEKLKIIAVTGTNGKTTTATLLFQLARQLKYKCGLVSTVVNKIDAQEIPSTHTTPDAISIQYLFARMVEAGCTYCFIEASSHALHQQRLTGTRITGAVFTNITHDHLDYHKTFAAYITAKKILFDSLPSSSFALINHDDKHSGVMVQNCKAKIRTYALQSMADYKAKLIENGFTGLHLSIQQRELYTRLIGGFNAYNILSVFGVASELGWNTEEVLTQLSLLEAPAGRFQSIKTSNNVTAVIDYAHTPDALENVLDTVKEIRTGNEQVITVVGCGGDRDKDKRPIMARIAAEKSDRVILTSDNPRSEEPDAILRDMKAGLDPSLLKKTVLVADRKEAIRLACSLAQDNDILLIAGKGHEKYQEIKGVKHPFDDYQTVAEALKALEK